VSPKNKGTFGKAKPTVEVEDEFVSGVNRGLQRLKPYAKQLVIGGCVALVAVFVAVGYNMIMQRKASHATELFDQALTVYAQPVMSDEEAALIKSMDLPNTPKDLVTHPSIAARADAALAILDKLEDEYGATSVAARARLLRASALYDAHRYDEAVKAYQAFAASDAPAVQRAIAREGIGYALEAKALAAKDAAARQQGLQQALAAFEKVAPGDDDVYRDYALFHQARLLQSLDRNEDAARVYRQVLETQPTTSLRNEIDARLAVLQVSEPASGAQGKPAATDKASATP